MHNISSKAGEFHDHNGWVQKYWCWLHTDTFRVHNG